MLESLRVICFDLDDTLWDVAPVLARAEERLHGWFREHYPRIHERWSAADLFAERRRLALEQPERAHDFTFLRLAVMQRCAVEAGYEARVAELAYEVWFGARNEVTAFEDVRPALARLRGRFSLATLSNGNADLARIGLADLFRVSLNARSVGAAKPHPQAFASVAEALGCAPEEILYVGDDPRVDVHGAREAGLRTAWMNRTSREWPAELPPADLEVRHCGEIVERLAPRGGTGLRDDSG